MITKETYWGDGEFLDLSSASRDLNFSYKRVVTVSSTTGGKFVRFLDPVAHELAPGGSHGYVVNLGTNAVEVRDHANAALHALAGGTAIKVLLGVDAVGAKEWILKEYPEFGTKDSPINNNPTTHWLDNELNSFDASLVSLWQLDDASGDAVDIINGNNLIPAGSSIVYRANGKIGALNGAVLLQGSGDRFSLDPFTSFPSTFSLGVWMKRVVSTPFRFIDFTVGAEVFHWEPERNTMRVFKDGTQVHRALLANAIDDKDWNHYVLTRHSNDSFSIWINGVKVPANLETNDPADFSGAGLFLGNSTASTTYGICQQLVLWDTPLSAVAIDHLHNAGAGRHYHV